MSRYINAVQDIQLLGKNVKNPNVMQFTRNCTNFMFRHGINYEVALQSGRVPFACVNIGEKYGNGSFRYSLNGGDDWTTITVKDGNYSVNGLVKTIYQYLVINGDSVNTDGVTYYPFIIGISEEHGHGVINFRNYDDTEGAVNLGLETWTDVWVDFVNDGVNSSSMWDFWGFSPEMNPLKETGNTDDLIADQPFFIFPHLALNVKINNVAGMITDTDDESGVIYTHDLAYSPFSTIVLGKDRDMVFYPLLSGSNLGNIVVDVEFEDGSSFDVNGQIKEVYITLQVREVGGQQVTLLNAILEALKTKP